MRRVENRHLTDREEIEKALRLGDYIKKGAFSLAIEGVLANIIDTRLGPETLALYSLRKYRHLKRMYPETPATPVVVDIVSRAAESSTLASSTSSG